MLDHLSVISQRDEVSFLERQLLALREGNMRIKKLRVETQRSAWTALDRLKADRRS